MSSRILGLRRQRVREPLAVVGEARAGDRLPVVVHVVGQRPLGARSARPRASVDQVNAASATTAEQGHVALMQAASHGQPRVVTTGTAHRQPAAQGGSVTAAQQADASAYFSGRWCAVATGGLRRRSAAAAAAARARPRDRAGRRHARRAERHHRRGRRARRATSRLPTGDRVRTGVTAILPHGGNSFREKVPGAVFVGNAFGKLAGSTQVEELGTIETPIVLTNTLSVGAALDGRRAVDGRAAGQRERALGQRPRRRNQRRQRSTTSAAFTSPPSTSRRRSPARRHGAVDEGAVGAGTGTIAFGWKGGIGTSSRVRSGAEPVDGRRARADQLRRTADDRGVPVWRELTPASVRRFAGSPVRSHPANLRNRRTCRTS